jgi:hypothetical protein
VIFLGFISKFVGSQKSETGSKNEGVGEQKKKIKLKNIHYYKK